ncbi:MAG: DUF502 domain-containing protein [Chloroflexi bacterium]|nr:DUF502 domain-containing protein [Chloroflexota bacterium]
MGTHSAPPQHSVRPSLCRRVKRSIGNHTRRTLITGSLLLIPVALTYLVLRFIFDVVDQVLGPGITWVLNNWLLPFLGIERTYNLPGVGVVVAVLLLYIVGILVANTVGQKLVVGGRRAVQRLPIIGTVYSATQRLVDSFSGTSATGFKRVVMIEYPQPGNWAVGFLTAITPTFDDGEPYAVVYIPTAPTPTSGWIAILHISKVYDSDISVQEAMQLVFSGGIVAPDEIKIWPLKESYERGEING